MFDWMNTNLKVWTAFSVLLLAISAVAVFTLEWGWALIGLIDVIVISAIIWFGFKMIPCHREYILKTGGRREIYGPGPCFIFPGIVEIEAEVNKGEQPMKLFGGRERRIVLKDGPVAIEAIAYARIVKTMNAAFEPNLISTVESNITEAFTSYLSELDFSQAKILWKMGMGQSATAVFGRCKSDSNGNIEKMSRGKLHILNPHFEKIEKAGVEITGIRIIRLRKI